MPVKGFHMLLLHLWSQYLKLLLGEFVLQLEEFCSLLLFDLGGTLRISGLLTLRFSSSVTW